MLAWTIAGVATIACVVLAVLLVRRRPEPSDPAADLTLLIDTFALPIVVLDAGAVFAVNRAFRIETERADEPLVGKPVNDLFDADMLSDRDVEISLPSGAKRTFFKSAARRVELGGKKLDILTLRDVTGERAAAAGAQIRDRLATVGTLVASSMHELKTPLTSMLLNVEFAIDAVKTNADENLLELMADLRQDTIRIQGLAEDLGTISAPQKDTLAPTDLKECAELAARLVRPEYKSRAELVCQLDEVPLVMSSDSRVRQILINLLTNALHAVQQQAGRPRVFLRTRGENGAALLEVEDEGPGIPTDIQRRMFEPMFTTKSYGSGTGLGLYLVRDLATKLGAVLEVDSEVGAGTKFTVRFDHGVPRSTSGTVTMAPTSSSPFDAKILVVDDKVSVLNTVCRALSSYEVTVARNGDEAIDLMARKNFDLALVDLMMPATDGRTVYREVSREAPDKAKRIRFMTGLACDEDLLDWANEEGVPVVRKPFDAAATVSAMLRQ